MSLNTTPRTWVTGEVVTAANMNTEVRDALVGVQAAWTTYTPAWTATTNPAIGNGTLTGRYSQVGKTIEFVIRITMGSTTTYGTGGWILTLPVASSTNIVGSQILGHGLAHDASAAIQPIISGVRFGAGIYAVNSAGTTVSATVPFTWATGDIFSMTGVYEAA